MMQSSTEQYCLSTTSLEQSWDRAGQNLFLGEWALPFEKRTEWQKYRGKVAEPFGMNTEERLAQFTILQELAKRVVDDLVVALNSLHGVAHGRRYWNIILGHWVQRFLSVLFNRHGTLKAALSTCDVSHSHVLTAEGFHPSTKSSSDFVSAANDPLWNHLLYARLLADTSAVPLRSAGAVASRAKEPHGRPNRLRQMVKVAVETATHLLTRDTDAFIVNSYLPRAQEVFLFLSLGQLPQKWRQPPLPDWEPDLPLRDHLRVLLGTAGDDFERLARTYLADFLPRCFLEGYADLQAIADTMPWPRKPRFIFTSNNFDSDEIFKVWTAGKVEEGTPYIVGQHGAGYGTHLFFQTQHGPEMSESDRFITWGWRDGSDRNAPAFVLKTACVKSSRPDAGTSDQLLIVAPVVPNQITHWDSLHEFSLNQQFQFRFVRALPADVRRSTVVRLHHGAANRPWGDIARWAEEAPDIPVDAGNLPLERQLAHTRLPVFAYDSTGLLEFLAIDRPAIGFWYGGLEHLQAQAKEDYRLLIDVGIVHLDPEAAARWVSTHWTDVEGWWDSPDVVRARQLFSARHARTVDAPIATLRRLLRETEASPRR